MFLETQPQGQKDYYKKMLKIIGSLSGIFADSPSPYLNYRATENLFCRAFEAENLSRGDTSADASKEGIGLGIKTFLQGNGNSFQKVAEFNKDFESFSGLKNRALIKEISLLRNERIESTKRIHELDDIMYHCIVRDEGKIAIFESKMDKIDIRNIADIDEEKKTKSIIFNDGIHEYNFNKTKSTLLRRFKSESISMEIGVDILKDPFRTLEELLSEIRQEILPVEEEREFVVLPLYSSKGARQVPERSGLNQWNANGRPRDLGEVYVPVPIWIHRKFPGFFPPKKTYFTLELPNGESLKARLCQQKSKAIMSYPNKALGKWLLRDAMGLKEGEILTIERLDLLGLDSVIIYKNKDGTFSIDFKKTGSYEEFRVQESGD